MSSVRFRSGTVDLELSGSESFVNRQLRLLSRYLEHVDEHALEATLAATDEPLPAPADDALVDVEESPADGDEPRSPEGNGLLAFFRANEPTGRDRQGEAALLFAYYLQRRERDGKPFRLGDLIRCCIHAGVDTRNFHRTLGTLARRGLIETLRHGQAYQLTEQGAAAVESRLS
jgi:hypothetical protein